MTAKKSAANICENRRAYFDYELLEKFEAGLVLAGWEVKSIRQGRVQLVGAHVKWVGEELFLIGARIDALQTATTSSGYDSDRSRKLLLGRREIKKIKGSIQIKGQSCVPLNLHWKGQLIKCEIATARGKKLKDKRETIKRRDLERSEGRAFKLS